MVEPVTETEPKTYATERAAQQRVEQLQRLGYWPGLVRCGERWRLTVDPDTAGQRRHMASEAGA